MKVNYFNPLSYVRPLGSRGFLNWMPDEVYIKLCYRAFFHKKLDLQNPKTYNEKLQWMKLYDRNPLYCTLADKVAVREYVARKVGEEYLIPLVGGPWDSPEQIDFDALPDRFVLKCSHGSGTNIICKNKAELDIGQTRERLAKWMRKSWFCYGREWPYSQIKPRIYAESYMEDDRDRELRDYKIFCFQGKAECMLVVTDRQNQNKQTGFDYYTTDYTHLPFAWVKPNAAVQPEKPQCFTQMLELAEKLAQGIDNVRVDLYSVNGKIYFGEYTLFHASGFAPFYPGEWDEKFGRMLSLK